MCIKDEIERVEEGGEKKRRRRWETVMGLKGSRKRMEKIRSSMASKSRMKLWMIRATTLVLLGTFFVQLTAVGEVWGPRVLKGWPSSFVQDSTKMDVKLSTSLPVQVLPPKS